MGNTHFSGPVYSANGFIGNITTVPSSITASTATITSDYAGKTIYVNRAAGSTITLPAATGTGNVYRFVLATAVTSNSTIIKVGNASDTMIGFAHTISDDPVTVKGFAAVAGTSDTITLNGGTTGGVSAGDTITVTDLALNVWSVMAFTSSSSTEATPFSATVPS